MIHLRTFLFQNLSSYSTSVLNTKLRYTNNFSLPATRIMVRAFSHKAKLFSKPKKIDQLNHVKVLQKPEKKQSLKVLKKNLGQQHPNFEPGNFLFISELIARRMLTNAYQAITKLNVWDFFDQEPPLGKGYMFWNHPILSQIAKELEKDGHSGSSFGYTLRQMQAIHQQGWNSYRDMWLVNSQKD